MKSYKESIKEWKKKLKDGEGYSELYRNYLNCLNNYVIVEDATYYWIELEDDRIGGQTEWVDWFNEERTLEIRRLRPVKPKLAIEMCTRVNEKPMVINSQMDAIIFLIYGGQAIVREDICEKYLSEFLQDFISPSSELKLFEE